MIKNLNLALVEGKLVGKPDLIQTNSGKKICNFTMAVNNSYKKDDETKETVSFIKIKTWNKVADSVAKYLDKGSKVRVRGSIEQERYTDKNQQKRSEIKIIAKSVDFLSTKKIKSAQ